MINVLLDGHAVPEAFAADPLVPPYAVPPHPRNVVFRQTMAARMLKGLGMSLDRLVDGDEFQRAAHHVRNFFAPELGIAESRIYTADIPRFLLPLDRAAGLIDPAQFAREMAALMVPEFDGDCPVIQNYGWLTELLHLTECERKLLLWSYCAETEHPAVLNRALGCVRCESWADAIEALSVLLEESVIAVAYGLSLPCRLRAMRLVLTDTQQVPSTLRQCMDAGETLVEVLETVHRSRSALLADLLEPRPHWTLRPQDDFTDELLVEWSDLPVADVSGASLGEHPMSAAQISVAIAWLTGWRIPAEHCQPLSGHLGFHLIELTVQRCFVEHAQRNQSVTQLALMQALYAVAAP